MTENTENQEKSTEKNRDKDLQHAIDIAVLKNEISSMKTAYDEIGKSTKEMAAISSDIKAVLSTYETKFNQVNELIDMMKDNNVSSRKEADDFRKEFKKNLTELSNEIIRRDEETYSKLLVELRDMKNSHENSVERIYNTIRDERDNQKKSLYPYDERIAELEKRTSSLEKWKYWVIGAAAAVALLLDRLLPFEMIFN